MPRHHCLSLGPVQKTTEKVFDVCCAGPASSGAVGEETVELPLLQPVEHGHCRCHARRCAPTDAGVVHVPVVQVVVWVRPFLDKVVDMLLCATTGVLRTVKVPQIQFIAGVCGQSSSQQRRVRFQQGYGGDE